MQSEIDGNEVVRRVVCQGYHVINNRDLTERQQVNDLLQKIDTVIEWNTGLMWPWEKILGNALGVL